MPFSVSLPVSTSEWSVKPTENSPLVISSSVTALTSTPLIRLSSRRCFHMLTESPFNPPFRGPFPKEKLDKIHQFVGKPILLCDFAIRFKDGDKDIRSWKPASDSIRGRRQFVRPICQRGPENRLYNWFFGVIRSTRPKVSPSQESSKGSSVKGSPNALVCISRFV